MANTTTNYQIPYPTLSDPVNVHGDIEDLAKKIDIILPELGVPYFTLQVKNVSGTTISANDPVYVTGFSTHTTVAKCDADDLLTFPVLGLAKAEILDTNEGIVVVSGIFDETNTSSFTAGSILYVASGGGLTDTQPINGSGAVGIVLQQNASTGIILVTQPKGNGTWGSLKKGLS